LWGGKTPAPTLSTLIPDDGQAALLDRMRRLQSGVVRYFSRTDYELGRPIRWHLNPALGVEWPVDRHWRRYSQFDASLGDLKLVWEANRFAFAYDLVRAYGLTGDAAWLRLGLDLIDEWIAANPVAIGIQWNCGQETTFRIMAWCFLLHAAIDADVIEPERFARIAASIYRHTLRVEHYISFSRSIRNNHSLSEALGLATIGLLFPQFDRSSTWRKKGLGILQSEAAYQIFRDGSYIQHSMNYHRLMLCDCLWMARLADLHEVRLNDAFVDRLRKATEYLLEMLDFESGSVPNFGSNDGALILPLTSCDYRDYRPIVQAAARRFLGRTPLGPGAHDELQLWMFGDVKAADAGERYSPSSASFDVGGYYTFRGDRAWGMTRCHTYFERPAQADMLHFDLWRDGENVLRDSGSYSYHCPAPWRQHFKSTAGHNTIVVENESQMLKGPRFMWYHWTTSRFIGRGALADGGEWWEGEHFGYQVRFGIIHRRRIERRGSDAWNIIDTLEGKGPVHATLRWRLPDQAFTFDPAAQALSMSLSRSQMRLAVIGEGDCVRTIDVLRGVADEASPEGWESLYYGEKSPIPV
ncbi:MAG: alginate lyase family protein, partial [Phycisphaerales bacterium]|nr:alginate lyase family protein [Phycisphaerales bacterium]